MAVSCPIHVLYSLRTDGGLNKYSEILIFNNKVIVVVIARLNIKQADRRVNVDKNSVLLTMLPSFGAIAIADTRFLSVLGLYKRLDMLHLL